MTAKDRRGATSQPANRPQVPQHGGRGRIYIAIDTESTGLEPDTGEIIEVAVLRFRLEPEGRVRVLDEWQTLIKPQHPIPYKITNLTGIAPADVEHAPSFAQVREKLRTLLGNYTLVGHSVESDVGFLRRQNFEVQNPTLDTYELATLVLPQQGNYSLKAVAEALAVQESGAHRALADARMTMNVFGALVGRIEALPTEVLQEVVRTAGRMVNQWSMRGLFQEALDLVQAEEASSGAVSNLGALLKMKLAQQPAANDNLGFLFLAQEEKPLPLVSKPLEPSVFEQLTNRVAVPIRDAFADKKHILLETPGDAPGDEDERNRGMVIAAVEKARREGRCVVLSAGTENKRERLLRHVVPEIQTQLAGLEGGDSGGKRRRGETAQSFKATTVKNQQNYLCLRRWETFRALPALTDDELKLLIRVLVWLPNTINGDCTELRISPNDRLWARINSLPGLCTPELCNQEDHPRCFYYRAKDRAAASHVVIADQSLVLADLVGQAGTLPSTNWIIIDDAHHLEDEASRQFGTVITPYQLFNFLDWLSRAVTWKPEGGNERTGFLHTVDRYYRTDAPDDIKTLINTIAEEAAKQVDYAREAAGNFMRELGYMLAQQNQTSGVADGRIRLDQKFRNGALWAESVGMWEGFHTQWEELYYRLTELSDEIDGVYTHFDKIDELETDLDYYVKQCDYFLTRMAAAFETGESGQIFWMGGTRLHANSSAAQAVVGDAAPEKAAVSIYSAPLLVGPVLEQRLFNKIESVALVSTTLSTETDFSFVKDVLGIDHSTPLEVRLSPTRNYKSTLLYLPPDMPEPNQPGYQKTVDGQIMELAQRTPGRMVAVFSSNSALRLTYKAIQRPLEGQKILVLGQGLDGSRRSMMHRFRATERAVMLTSLNFWETADLQGDDDEEAGLFNLLVITKLPFDPPTDPLFAARIEGKLYDRPFEQYSLPRTILRFRQAFDRLLVAQPERSAVVMLDSRLITKSYGSQFLNSLPPLTHHRDALGLLSRTVTDWLK
jgi:DNA polymerase III epsilon subunit family exonuclease